MNELMTARKNGRKTIICLSYLFIFLHLCCVLRHFEKTFVGAAAGFFAFKVIGSLLVVLHRLLQIDHFRFVDLRDRLVMFG